MSQWFGRLWTILRRDRLSAEIEEELRFHLAMREEWNRAEGMGAEDARADAHRRFGNATRVHEGVREANILTFLDGIARDLRFAVRMLAKHPGYTAMALLALATGIGINTAVFTAYKAFLLRPLDGVHPEELFNIYHSRPEHAFDPGMSYPDFEDQRRGNHSFSGILAATGDEFTMTEAGTGPAVGRSVAATLIAALGFRMPVSLVGSAESVRVAIVSDNFFQVLGVNAVRGRVFQERDAQDLSRRPQILISENYWNRRFGGQESVLRGDVKLNGAAFRIIGVTPHDFMGTFTTQVPDFWMPLESEPLVRKGSDLLANREKICCTIVGRLAAGVTPAQAQAETEALADRLRQLHAPGSEGSRPLTVQIAPGSPFQRPRQDPQLKLVVAVMLGAVGLVLLIACANVAGMQLARGAARRREIGVRLSLGASRARLVRQLLTESALLGLIAGTIAAIFSFWALRVLVTQAASAMPIEWGTFALHISPDRAIFAYVLLLSLLASVLFGLAPALESSRFDLASAVKDDGARTARRLGGRRLQNILLAAQAGICLFLLVMAGLLIHSSARALDQRTGYEAKHVLELDLEGAEFNNTEAKQLAENRQIREQLTSLPGVTGVTAGRSPDGGGLREAKVPGARTVFYAYVLPNYFETLDIPLVAGRTFDGAGDDDARVVVSESAARSLWPGANPIGRSLQLDVHDEFHPDGEPAPERRTYVVSGVARDTRGVLLDGSDSAKVYLPLRQANAATMPLLVRTVGDPAAMQKAIGRVIHDADANLRAETITLADALSNSPQFVIARCSGLFATTIALLGLLLASAGIYGSVSYAVVRRTREVGIRVALGAGKNDVLRLVLGETARPVLAGLAAGLVATAAAAQFLRALLNGLAPLDPLSFLGVPLLFLAITLLAAFFPARRALEIEPVDALRSE